MIMIWYPGGSLTSQAIILDNTRYIHTCNINIYTLAHMGQQPAYIKVGNKSCASIVCQVVNSKVHARHNSVNAYNIFMYKHIHGQLTLFSVILPIDLHVHIFPNSCKSILSVSLHLNS